MGYGIEHELQQAELRGDIRLSLIPYIGLYLVPIPFLGYSGNIVPITPELTSPELFPQCGKLCEELSCSD